MICFSVNICWKYLHRSHTGHHRVPFLWVEVLVTLQRTWVSVGNYRWLSPTRLLCVGKIDRILPSTSLNNESTFILSLAGFYFALQKSTTRHKSKMKFCCWEEGNSVAFPCVRTPEESFRSVIQLHAFIFPWSQCLLKQYLVGAGKSDISEFSPGGWLRSFCVKQFFFKIKYFFLTTPLLVGPPHFPPFTHSPCSGSVPCGVQPHGDGDVWRWSTRTRVTPFLPSPA